MPFIRVTTFGTDLTAEQVKMLQDVTTDLMVTVMRKPLAGTAVLVEEPEHGGWSIAGVQVPVGAHVEATIGAGTNTAEEKAEFISKMMNALKSILGSELRDETYISILEFNHDAYGRGGLTRAVRECRLVAG